MEGLSASAPCTTATCASLQACGSLASPRAKASTSRPTAGLGSSFASLPSSSLCAALSSPSAVQSSGISSSSRTMDGCCAARAEIELKSAREAGETRARSRGSTAARAKRALACPGHSAAPKLLARSTKPPSGSSSTLSTPSAALARSVEPLHHSISCRIGAAASATRSSSVRPVSASSPPSESSVSVSCAAINSAAVSAGSACALALAAASPCTSVPSATVNGEAAITGCVAASAASRLRSPSRAPLPSTSRRRLVPVYGRP
mmetsp:Transcript_21558/g.46399  ORF Transcript_21558/g.46399 Transcript_21558/m.46399 type:complete len:263 (-) Transcript_21558:429-1217(-)